MGQDLRKGNGEEALDQATRLKGQVHRYETKLNQTSKGAKSRVLAK